MSRIIGLPFSNDVFNQFPHAVCLSSSRSDLSCSKSSFLRLSASVISCDGGVELTILDSVRNDSVISPRCVGFFCQSKRMICSFFSFIVSGFKGVKGLFQSVFHPQKEAYLLQTKHPFLQGAVLLAATHLLFEELVLVCLGLEEDPVLASSILRSIKTFHNFSAASRWSSFWNPEQEDARRVLPVPLLLRRTSIKDA